MSKRGDFSSIRQSFKSYWKDRKKHPWNRICKALEEKMGKLDSDSLSKQILLIREAVFCSLDMASLSLPLDMSTDEIISIVTKQSNWKEGRREARSHCASMLQQKIESGEINCLVATGLEKDGFGYLLPDLREARIEKFRKAKPSPDSGKINLADLRQSKYGRSLLRSLNILEPSLEASDERVERLLEKYDHQLLDLELSETVDILPDDHTEQVTLNGSPFQHKAEETEESQTSKIIANGQDVSKQEDLTDYVTENLSEVRYAGDLQALDGIGPTMESRLKETGYDSFVTIAHAQAHELSSDVRGIGTARAEMLIKGARKLLEGGNMEGES